MSAGDIKKMIATERVFLTKGQLFWHYSILLLLLISPIYTTVIVFQYYIFHNYKGVRPIHEMMEGYYWLIPLIVLFFIQKQRLRFKTIKVKCSVSTFKEAVEETANELEWDVKQLSENIVVATSGFSFRSWGERITIIRTEDYILFNSICDPDNRPSIASFGMNRMNRRLFEKILQKKNINSQEVTV